MSEIFVARCSKCKHNTPQQYRKLTTAVGDQPNTYEDIGPWIPESNPSSDIKARQCLVCGRYFSEQETETQLKVR